LSFGDALQYIQQAYPEIIHLLRNPTIAKREALRDLESIFLSSQPVNISDSN